jgi:hypothetical protein
MNEHDAATDPRAAAQVYADIAIDAGPFSALDGSPRPGTSVRITTVAGFSVAGIVASSNARGIVITTDRKTTMLPWSAVDRVEVTRTS